jgi:hypothetical protein
MMIYFLFYSAKDLVNFAVVFFVVAADFANERHQYKETTTDDRNHNFSCHFIIRLQDLARFVLILFEQLLLVLLRAPNRLFAPYKSLLIS